jgi:hypothetical protein
MMLVGGERLRYILSRQGDQLNRFSLEHLNYFSRSTEWEDYSALVQRPSQPDINWNLACVTRLFDLTNGHPYYTKLLCREAHRAAVDTRDTEITPTEIDAAVANLAGGLDLHNFSHFWMDGILADSDVSLSVELDRRRLFVAAARACRSGQPIRLDSIVQQKDLLLDTEKAKTLLDEFVKREILREDHGTYSFNLPLFESWLVNAGVSKLIPEQSAQKQAALARRSEDDRLLPRLRSQDSPVVGLPTGVSLSAQSASARGSINCNPISISAFCLSSLSVCVSWPRRTFVRSSTSRTAR